MKQIWSSGGKFKRQSFGDLGLRAYQEQQNQIIESLKLQQLRTEQYADEFVVEKEKTHRAEAENRNKLQGLENDVFENKRRNIEIRADREVKALMGEADEYGRKAQFWKDFSTTYSKQWAELAEGTLKYAGMKQGQAHIKKLEKNGIGDLATIDKWNRDSFLAVAEQANAEGEKAAKNGDDKEAQKLFKVPTFARYYVETDFKRQVKDNWELILNEVKTSIGADYNKDPAGYVDDFIDNLAIRWGLDPSRQSLREIKQFAKSKVNAEVIQLNLAREYKARNEAQGKAANNFYSVLDKRITDPEVFNTSWTNFRNLSSQTYTKDERNRIVPLAGTPNLGDGSRRAMKRMIDDGQISTWDEFETIYYHVIPKANRWDEETLNEIKDYLIDKTAADRTRENGLIKVNDEATLTEVKAQDWNWNDFGRDGDRQRAFALIKTHEGKPKTVDWLSKQLSYNSTKGRDHWRDAEQLRQYAHENNWPAFNYKYQMLSQSDRQEYRHLHNDLVELQRLGVTIKSRQDEAKQIIEGESRTNRIAGVKPDPSEDEAIEGYVLTEQNYFNSLQGKISNVADRWEEAKKRTSDDWNHKNEDGTFGKGLLRRRTPRFGVTGQKNTIYLAYAPEEYSDKLITVESIQQKFNNTKPEENQTKLQTLIKNNINRIAATDELDAVIRNAAQGGGIRPNAVVNEIVRIANLERMKAMPNTFLSADERITHADVYNIILKERGSNFKVKPNAVDFSRAVLDKAGINHNPLPEPVVCIIGGYCAYIKDTGIPSNLMRPEIRDYIDEKQRLNWGVS